ncbi:MAG: AAA family ATPase [Candidatus Omnitrophota bacterium]
MPRALNFVKVKPELEGLLGHLIANVYVAEDAVTAAQTVRAHPSVICVTRQGERFEAKAVMGGSLSASADAALIGRDARIRDLEQQRSATAQRLSTEQQELDRMRAEQIELTGRIGRLSEELMNAQVQMTDKRNQGSYLEEQLQKQRTRHEQLTQDLATLSQRRQELEGLAGECQERCDRQMAEEKVASDSIAECELAVAAKTAEKEELLIRLTQTRSRQSEFSAKREKIEKDCNWILESKGSQEELLVSFENEMRGADAKREGLELECGSLEVQIAEWTQTRDEGLMNLESLTRDRDVASAEVQQKEAQRSREFTQLAAVKDKIHALEMDGAQIQFSIDRLKEKIFNAYQVDLMVRQAMAETEAAVMEGQSLAQPATDAIAQAPLDLEGAHAQIQAQRDKLNKMGPVNLAATEEYEELRSRYDFLSQQQQDLVKAKEDLHQAIIKINRTTRELFVETFAKIQQYFHDYFRMLFNGGQAELVMIDEQNVLESGIEIVARPPGKKLQNITLLSGGEKALTAIALLFALFKVKPSPFCILDEIDAPLDETNVERFCRLLKDFIGQSQFILITHNKRTINLSDAMYGITMSQTGVSQVVSVRFAQKQANAAEDQKPEPVIA